MTGTARQGFLQRIFETPKRERFLQRWAVAKLIRHRRGTVPRRKDERDPSGAQRFGADALNLVFRVDGRVAERLLYRGEEADFEIVEAGRSYSLDADGGLLRLASEAYRIRLAHLFDPYLAVSASQIEALPHQITAVYGEMLPRQPLRFLLADDPGAGKTIMAGLLIKELLIRGDLERCLIVAPGSLVEQWQEEMAEKFSLGFDLLTRDQVEASITGNPFVEKSRLIVRLDMAARSVDTSNLRLDVRQVGSSEGPCEVHLEHRPVFGRVLGLSDAVAHRTLS